MNVNPNPWIIESRIEYCKDRAKQNGFRLERGDGNNTINVVAQKEPYGKDVVIARCYEWMFVEMFLMGYEQGILEANIVATLARNRKAKPKEPEHIDSETCWCKPELDYTDPDTGVSVYVHRRLK